MTATNAPSPQKNLSAEQKAHEPSMDDILASIRRIIADDDALPLSRRPRVEAAPETTASAPPKAAAPTLAASGDAFLGLGQRLGRNAEPASPEPVAAPTVLTPAQPPMLRLRDFMPREAPRADAPARLQAVEPQSPTSPVAASQVAVEPPAEALSAQPAAADAPAGLRPSLAEAEKPADSLGASVVSLAPSMATAGEPRLKIASLSFRAPVFKPPGSESSAAPTAPEQPAREPAPEIPDAGLLSSASGAKIGASFEALAESMLLRDPQMFERLTREMLRPMLKAWLDDNLPVVVERLVRAEIERVARGRG